MQSLASLTPLLATPQNICITTHQFPDADALGSSLALKHYLTAKGHNVIIMSSTPYPENLAWMPGAKDVMVFYDHKLESFKQALDECSILYCLDFNVISRTKELADIFTAFKGIRVLVDHHMFPDEAFFNYGISDTEKSSTCELIYDYLCTTLNDAKSITKEIAVCLYAGTMTDTGSFRYSSTSAATHRMVAHLMDCGVVPNSIHEQIFDVFPERRLKLLGFLLSNRLEVNMQYKFALMWVTEQDAETFEIQQGDTEGFVNYPLGIKGVDSTAFVTYRDGEVRMSFRSKGDVDVNQFARQYFNGGGHQNASGGKGFATVQQTCEAVWKAVAEWKA